ncbi:MAG TPA: serine/threonine-protein kinase [Polyangiaceae bacterium]|nr:serine/threonine-protein kinase [Polyangiaceae bacterium]
MAMTPLGRLRAWLRRGPPRPSLVPTKSGGGAEAGGGTASPNAGLESRLRTIDEDTGYKRGDVIAEKYRLERRLGGGGMSDVWVAQNLALESPVALKFIRPDAASASASQRLLREARTTARLTHPSVVRVFDFGLTERGDPFLAMELLRGEGLSHLLERQGPLPPRRAVQLLLPALEGLATAHSRGVVHRDLKPENIFLALDDAGRVRPTLIDFGIAKTTVVEKKLTKTGTLLGSPSYVSPEQARGEAEIDARSDVWSACVTLYELLTGKTPFTARDFPTLLWSIINDPAPRLPDSEGLADIVDRGLRKARDERWASAAELGRALAAWLLAQGVSDDACGTSLQTTWLGPTAPGGAAGGGVKPPEGLWGRLVRLMRRGAGPAHAAPPGALVAAPFDLGGAAPSPKATLASAAKALSSFTAQNRPLVVALVVVSGLGLGLLALGRGLFAGGGAAPSPSAGAPSAHDPAGRPTASAGAGRP